MTSPLPTGSISNNPNVLINSSFSIETKFRNTSINNSDIGFKPMIDILIPKGIIVDNILDSMNISLTPSLIATWDITQLKWIDTNSNEISSHPSGSTLSMPDTLITMSDLLTYENEIKWYTFESHYSSYGSDQPDVMIATLNCTLSESNGAIIELDMPIKLIPSFKYGIDAEDNDTIDPAIQGPVVSSSVTPKLIILTKTNLLPESEVATGPNFPFYFKLQVEVAPQKTVTNLVVTDEILESMVYIDNSYTSNISIDDFSISNATNGQPDRSIEWTYDTITGSSDVDITIQYQVYIPYKDFSNVLILNNTTGEQRTISTIATTDYKYNNVNSQVSDNDTFNAKSMAIQKTVSSSSSTVIPGSTLDYVQNIQISDYFSFENIILEDILSDGHKFNSDQTTLDNFNLRVKTGQINNTNQSHSKYVSVSINLDDDNTTINNVHIDDVIDQSTLKKNGERSHINLSTVIDDIMNATHTSISNGINGRLYGGICKDNESTETTIGNNYNVGSTTIILTYSAKVDTLYNNEESSVQQIDINDYVNSSTTVTGDNYDYENLSVFQVNSNDVKVDDISGTNTNIGSISIFKTVYAINSIIGSYNSNTKIYSGDLVTYRIKVNMSHQNVQDLVIKDYLPPPIIDVDDFTTFSGMLQSKDIDAESAPAKNNLKYCSDHSYHLLNLPILSKDSNSNALEINFGTYQSNNNIASQIIDILYTVEVSDEPTADGLILTNQAIMTLNCTKNRPLSRLDWTGIILNQPIIEITKSIIKSDNTETLLSPSISNDVIFNDVGTIGFNGSIMNGTDFAELNANATKVQGADTIKYCIVLKNHGHGNSYRTTIKDVLDTSNVIVDISSIHITDGSGSSLNISNMSDLFAENGLDLGIIAKNSDISSDTNSIIVITYETDVLSTVEIGITVQNTVSIIDFTNKVGGKKFYDSFMNTNSSQFTIKSIELVKKILSTSEIHTATQNNQNNTREDCTIGEEVDYQITITFPRGTTKNFILTDEFDGRIDSTSNCGQEVLSYNFIQSNHISPLVLSESPSYTTNNRYRNYPFGNIVNTTDKTLNDDIQIIFNTTTRLTDYVHSGSGDIITTKAIGRYNVNNNVKSQYSNNVKIYVREPNIILTKSFHTETQDLISNSTNGLKPSRDDIIKYVIKIDSTSSDIDAQNLVVSDALPANLNILSVSLSDLNGSTIPDGGTLIHFNETNNKYFKYTIDSYPTGIFTDIIAECQIINYHSGNNVINGSDIKYYSVQNTKQVFRTYTNIAWKSFNTLPTVNVVLSNITYNHGNDIGSSKKGTIGDTIEANYKIFIPKGTTTLHRIKLNPSIDISNITFDTSNISITKTSNLTWSNDHTISSENGGIVISVLNNNDLTVSPIIDANGIILDINRDLANDLVVDINEIDQYLSFVFTFALNNTSTNISSLLTTMNDITMIMDSTVDKNITHVYDSTTKSYYIVEPEINLTHELIYLPLNNSDDLRYKVTVSSIDSTYTTDALNIEWIEAINTNDFSSYDISTLASGWSNDSLSNQLISKISRINKGSSYEFEITKTINSVNVSIDDFIQNIYDVKWGTQQDTNAIIQRNNLNSNNSNNLYIKNISNNVKLEQVIDSYQYGLCFEDALDFDFDYEDVVVNATHTIYRNKYGIKQIILDYHLVARGAAFYHTFGVYVNNINTQTGTWKVINSFDSIVSDPDPEIKTYQQLDETNSLSSLTSNKLPIIVNTKTALPPDLVDDTFSTNTNDRIENNKTWGKPYTGRVIIDFITPYLKDDIKILPYIDVWGYNTINNTTEKEYTIILGDRVDYSKQGFTNYPRAIVTNLDFIHGHDYIHNLPNYYPDFATYALGSYDYTDIKSRMIDINKIDSWITTPSNTYTRLRTLKTQYTELTEENKPDDKEIYSQYKDINTMIMGANNRQKYNISENGIDNRKDSNDIDINTYDNVVQISQYNNSDIYILRSDGTVSTTSSVDTNVNSLTNIVAITAFIESVIGINSDLTVSYTGTDTNISTETSTWTDIHNITCSGDKIYGLDRSGNIFVSSLLNSSITIDITGWGNLELVKLFGSYDVLVGLTKYGNVYISRIDGSSPKNIWTSYKFKDISCGNTHILGLTDLDNNLFEYNLGTTTETNHNITTINKISAQSTWDAFLHLTGNITTTGAVPNAISLTQNMFGDTYGNIFTTKDSIIIEML